MGRRPSLSPSKGHVNMCVCVDFQLDYKHALMAPMALLKGTGTDLFELNTNRNNVLLKRQCTL